MLYMNAGDYGGLSNINFEIRRLPEVR
jgi:hypothetical protein